MSQDALVLAALAAGEALTPALAAERWGILALHSAIARLRAAGYSIPCAMRYGNGRRWGEYRLTKGMP